MDIYATREFVLQTLPKDKMEVEEEFVHPIADKLRLLEDNPLPVAMEEEIEESVIAQEEDFQHTLEVAGAKSLDGNIVDEKESTEICLNQHRKQDEIHCLESTNKSSKRSQIYTDSESYLPSLEPKQEALASFRAIIAKTNWIEFLDPIGSGATSKCYKFHCKRTNSEVAVKLLEIKSKNCKNSDYTELHLDETRMLQGVQGHQNIMRFMGADTTEENYVILTRFESGGTVESEVERMRQESVRFEKNAYLAPGVLERELKRLNRERTEMTLHLAPQLFGGLAHLHGIGIAHLDIKTANLLLDSRKEKLVIGDFGSAKEVDSYGIFDDQRKTVGTPGFFAPEMVNFDFDCGISCDIYSAGVSLYIMLTGQHPYSTDTPWGYREECHKWPNFWRAGKAKDTPPPAQAPEHLRDVIRRCLLRNPRERISAEEAYSQLS